MRVTTAWRSPAGGRRRRPTVRHDAGLGCTAQKAREWKGLEATYLWLVMVDEHVFQFWRWSSRPRVEQAAESNLSARDVEVPLPLDADRTEIQEAEGIERRRTPCKRSIGTEAVAQVLTPVPGSVPRSAREDPKHQHPLGHPPYVCPIGNLTGRNGCPELGLRRERVPDAHAGPNRAEDGKRCRMLRFLESPAVHVDGSRRGVPCSHGAELPPCRAGNGKQAESGYQGFHRDSRYSMLCRSAAEAPHERFVDVTPMSLRRGRPRQLSSGHRN